MKVLRTVRNRPFFINIFFTLIFALRIKLNNAPIFYFQPHLSLIVSGKIISTALLSSFFRLSISPDNLFYVVILNNDKNVLPVFNIKIL